MLRSRAVYMVNVVAGGTSRLAPRRSSRLPSWWIDGRSIAEEWSAWLEWMLEWVRLMWGGFFLTGSSLHDVVGDEEGIEHTVFETGEWIGNAPEFTNAFLTVYRVVELAHHERFMQPVVRLSTVIRQKKTGVIHVASLPPSLSHSRPPVRTRS